MPQRQRKGLRRRSTKPRATMPLSKRQVKAVRKIAQKSGELKSKTATQVNDTSITETSVYKDFVMESKLAIAEGTGSDERVGKVLKLKKFMANIRVFPGSAGLGTSHTYRLLIVQYLGDQEDETGNGIEASNPLEYLPDLEAMTVKYKVLYNQVFSNLGSTNKQNNYHKIRINGNRLMPIQYSESSVNVLSGEIAVLIIPLTTTVDQLQASTIYKSFWYDA